MKCKASSRSKPIGRGTRFLLVGFVLVLSTIAMSFLVRVIGLPGIAAVAPNIGVVLFTDWLLSGRPAPPLRTWIALFVACFLACPAAAVITWHLLR